MGVPLAEGIPLIGKAGRVYAYLENRLSTHASTVIASNNNKNRHIDPLVPSYRDKRLEGWEHNPL